MISVNGKNYELTPDTTLSSFINQRGLDPNIVVVELNRTIPAKEHWSEIKLSEGDQLEIIQFVGGG